MSPGDLGQRLKPFVFLDLFNNGGKPLTGFGLHPHSGIATLTYMAQGNVSYEDTNGATGLLPDGGVLLVAGFQKGASARNSLESCHLDPAT